MSDQPFVDYYDLLELSPKASPEAIECMFRIMAKRYNPETGIQKDTAKYHHLAQAYRVLRDPETRKKYDSQRSQNELDTEELAQIAAGTSEDYLIRHRLLSLFYAQRKRSMSQPGVGIAKLEELMKIPTEVIEFHLWYFREKGWVQRETAGPLSITAVGVDEIEAREQREIKRSRAARAAKKAPRTAKMH
jgi:curved DNA-binding protein